MIVLPMLLRPTMRVNAVYDVTSAMLKAHGLDAVMVDLDDTLVASNAEGCAQQLYPWFEQLQSAEIKVVILSNGTRERVARWSEEFGVDALSLAGKPFWFAYRRGLNLLGTEPDKTAMIGDQLFTDILGANLLGMTTILVDPLSAGKLFHTRLARKLERLILGGEHGRFIYRG